MALSMTATGMQMQRRSALMAPPARMHAVSRRAVQVQAKNDPLLKFSKNVGLDPSEGLFGFRPFAELWTGRLAMMGFVTSIVEEFVTGQGTLAQIHLMDDRDGPSLVVLAAILAVFGGITLYASFTTLTKLRSNALSPADRQRYKGFLGLDKEGAEQEEARRMKAAGDFTTPGNNMAAVAAAKAAGAPVDAFLSTSDLQEGSAAAKEMKDSERAAAQAATNQQNYEEAMYGEQDMKYALEVEMTNGRMAMLGFLAAVVVEAATGNGIIMQCIGYVKASGMLGAESGF